MMKPLFPYHECLEHKNNYKDLKAGDMRQSAIQNQPLPHPDFSSRGEVFHPADKRHYPSKVFVCRETLGPQGGIAGEEILYFWWLHVFMLSAPSVPPVYVPSSWRHSPQLF